MDCLFLCNAMDIYSSKSVRLRNYPFFRYRNREKAILHLSARILPSLSDVIELVNSFQQFIA